MNSLLRTRGAARALSRSQPRAALSTSRISHSASPNPLDPLPSPSASAASPSSPAFSAHDAPDVNTHFGFKDVPESAKESMVKGVFSSVASSYDVMNDAMSLGIHRLWKDHYVSKLDPNGPLQCLDVAGGTGDIAIRILDHARTKWGERDLKVNILDINPEMLDEGRKRVAKTMYGGGNQVEFTLGNAEDLHTIPSNSIDLYTIAFGIRNVTHIDLALKEAYRVLKPGGVFSCLEFSKVTNPLLAQIYHTYSFQVIPTLGHLIAADRDSYQYLVESIERFPPQAKFSKMIEQAGFTVPKREPWEDLTFGVATVFTGVKL